MMKITEQQGVKNSFAWQYNRIPHIAFHMLSNPDFLPGSIKAAQHLI